jgi:branched-chain amino acid transport system ATP-binding protein
MVANGNGSHVAADLFDDAGTLVAQDHRQRGLELLVGAQGHGWGFLGPLLKREGPARAEQERSRLAAWPRADVPAADLAYGERRQLEMAMALAAKPKFVLLDEPMAGMSVQESAQVVAMLKRLRGRYSILLIEHDMEAVFALADRITVLVYGKVMFTETSAEIRQHPEVRVVYLGEEDEE